MRRSSIITRFAVEAGYIEEKNAKLLEKEYQKSAEAQNLTFESWAITKGYLKIKQAKSLLETISDSRFMCTSCGKAFLGKELIGGTEYLCPECNGQDFLLQGKAKSANDKISKAPKLMTPSIGIAKNELKRNKSRDPEASVLDRISDYEMKKRGLSENPIESFKKTGETTGVGSKITDSVIQSEEKARREIEDIENESQKALKKAVFSAIDPLISKKKASDKSEAKDTVFTAEMMDKGLPPGALLDGIKIEKIIGRGGIGIVYKGKDLTLERPVALKVLNSDVLSDKGQVERFGIEARSMAQLEHPNVVQVYKFGEKFGRPYLSMQWVDGENIGQKIDQQGALPITETLNWFIQTARGLLEAHNHGIIHRDIKPDNIIVNSKGNVKIVDFGLAKQVVKAEHIGLSDPRFVLGTPAYIAPEQALGEEIDNRTDIYSFAISMFHALTGRLPFTGSPAAVVHQHISTPLPYANEFNPLIPNELNRLIKVMSSKNMENRPNDMAEIVDELERILFEYDPDYANQVNILPKFDPSLKDNKKIIKDSKEILAVYDESEDETGNVAQQIGMNANNKHNEKQEYLDGVQTKDSPHTMKDSDLFADIEDVDIFNTTGDDFSPDEIDLFATRNVDMLDFSQDISEDQNLNHEIQKIKKGSDKTKGLPNSNNDSFFNGVDAFEDLQMEVLESERSGDFTDFMKDDKQKRNKEDQDYESITPIDEIDYSEETDVVIADEEDILITAKLHTQRKDGFLKDKDDEYITETDADELSNKVRLQVSQSFTSRSHKDDDSDSTDRKKKNADIATTTITPEQAAKLMRDHQKFKSPRSISVIKIIPKVSIFLVVFILSFILFLSLTSNSVITAEFGDNREVKVSQTKLIDRAQQCLSEKNGTLAKVTLSSMQNLEQNNPKFKFSAEFMLLKSDLSIFMKEYKKQEIKENGRFIRDKIIKNMTVDEANKHLEEIKSYISMNSKYAVEFKLDEKMLLVEGYIKERQDFENDEIRIKQIMNAYEGVDTSDLSKLFSFKDRINGLLNTRPLFEKDPRIIDIINKIKMHIDNTPQKKELIKIYQDFEQVHQPGTKVDLTKIIEKFNNFLKNNDVFKNADEIAIKIRKEAPAKFKEETNMEEELEDAYTKWVQITDKAKRNNQVAIVLTKFNNYISKVPRFESDPTIENNRDHLERSLVDTKDETAQILAFKNESESADTIEKIDDLKQRIHDYLRKNIHLIHRLKDTNNKLEELRANLVIKRDEAELANQYAAIVKDIIKKLHSDKSVVAEGEKLLNKLTEMVEKTLKNTEQFVLIIKQLKDALNHERLISQADWNGFSWKAELVEINDSVKLMKYFDSKSIGHRTEITVLTFDNAMKFMMSCDKSGIVKVFLVENFEEIRSISINVQINAAVFTGKPEIVVFALGNGNLELWNIALRQKIKVIRKFDKPIQSLAYFNDSIFCSGDESRILQISLSEGFKELNNFSEPRGNINSISISPDKKWLAAGCSDNKTYIWSLDDKETQKVLHGYHTASISQVSFSEDSQKILTNSEDGKAAIWSLMSGSESRLFSTKLTIKSGRFLNENKVILISESTSSAFGIESKIEVVDINRPTETIKIDTVSGIGKIAELVKISDKKYLLYATKDGSINIYIQDKNNVWQSVAKTDFIVEAEMLDKNRIIKIFRSGRIQISDVDKNIDYNELLNVGVINCASISIQEKKAVIGTNKGILLYVNFEENEITEKNEIDRFNSPITTVSIKKDASQVIVGLSDTSAFIYDSKGKQSKAFPKSNNPIDISATNANDTLAIYGMKSGHLTPISLPAGIKGSKSDISIRCNKITFAEFNKKEKTKKDDLLFIGYINNNNKGELIKLDTEYWKDEKLISNLTASIISVVEISNTQMLVGLENGEIISYQHNLYNESKDIFVKFTETGRFSILNSSDFVFKYFYRDGMLYLLTHRGTTIVLEYK